jgi:hypothetical protein
MVGEVGALSRRVCAEEIYAERTDMGDGLGVSGFGVVCVDDSSDESAVPGVRSVGVTEGSEELGGMSTSRAGFGKVLYVEPREVYLLGGEMTVVWKGRTYPQS